LKIFFKIYRYDIAMQLATKWHYSVNIENIYINTILKALYIVTTKLQILLPVNFTLDHRKDATHIVTAKQAC
jgi:hypothetical protein